MVPLFFILWALSNFFGPLLLGRLMDTVGRKPMIAISYLGSAVLAVVLAVLFGSQTGGVWLFIAVLAATFFLASTGASAAYLTVSELFPLEARAMAIALFYALGTGIATLSPTLFGALIATHSRTNVNYGYLLGAGLMVAAGVIAIFLAVDAERRSLEDIARPFTAARDRVAARSGTFVAASGG